MQWQSGLLRVDGLVETIALLLGAGLLVWVLRCQLCRVYFNPAANTPKPEVISLLNGLYAFGYFLTLVATMTFFDPATRFQLRILAPIFVSLLLCWLSGCIGRACTRTAGSCSHRAERVDHNDIRFGPGGDRAGPAVAAAQIYANERWYDAKAITALQSLPADVAIHTNQPGVV